MYKYKCPDCGTINELQHPTEDNTCKKCGKILNSENMVN